MKQIFYFEDYFEEETPLEYQVVNEVMSTQELMEEIEKIDNEMSILSEKMKILKNRKKELLDG